MTRNEFIKIFGRCPFEMIKKGHGFSDPIFLAIQLPPLEYKFIMQWTVAHCVVAFGHENYFNALTEDMLLLEAHDNVTAECDITVQEMLDDYHSDNQDYCMACILDINYITRYW